MNNFFVDAVPNLGIKKSVYLKDVEERGAKTMEQKIDAILESYKSHPSIVMIKGKVNVTTKFKFKDTTAEWCTAGVYPRTTAVQYLYK